MFRISLNKSVFGNGILIYSFQFFVQFILGGTTLICLSYNSFALDPHKSVTQYVHNVWTTNEGLPQDTVNAVTQDGDGYIWFGTQEGLVRFDGVQFVTFDSYNNQAFKSGVITTVFTDRKGVLWIGASDALLRYKNGDFTRFGEKNGLWDGFKVKNISEDKEGNLWLGYSNGDQINGGIGLIRFKDEQGVSLTTQDGLSADQIKKTFPDQQGNLWIATSNGLSRLKDGKFTNYTVNDGLSDNLVRTIYGDRAGNLWIGTANGLTLLKDGKFTVFTTKDGLSNNYIFSLYEDTDGILWIGTESGLNRMIDGKIDSVKGIKGLENDEINDIYEDSEKSLWFGTHASGIHRLNDTKFTPYGSPEGLLGENVNGIYEDHQGNILIATNPGGLNILKNGKFTTYSTINGLASNKVRAIIEDRDGTFWIGTKNGLNRFKDGKFTTYTTKDGLTNNTVLSFYEAGDGTFWIGTQAGLTQLINGKFIPFPDFEDFRNNYIHTICEDRTGRVWIGMDDFTGYFKDGVFTQYREGVLKRSNIQVIFEDDDGVLWFGGWNGLSRLKNGNLTTYLIKDGLFDDNQWSILDDGKGNLWMGSNRGIYSVSKQQLDDFAEGRIDKITSNVYGTADGMRKSETNAGNPASLRSKDGRLWFATTAGVVAIDPNKMKINRIPPPVVLEQVLVDEKPIAFNEFTTVAPSVKNLEFRYAGLSFVLPAKVKYKYKLAGFDEDWIDVGTRHSAYFTNLSPGDYEFTVIAANNDGVWNEQGAKIKFRVLSPFWKTWWFLSGLFLCVGGIGFLFYRFRINILEKERATQQAFSQQLIESQEKERRRIAAELHDGIGQSLVILKNRAIICLNSPENYERLLGQMEEISDGASAAIVEVRGIVRNLHPYQIDFLGLTTALKTMIDSTAEVSNIKFSHTIDELDGELSKESQINLYRIVQEALSNAVKHSNATKASVSLKKNGHTLDLLIEDNGKGFSFDSPNKQRGFGLVGISERANMLNANLDFNSSPENGTTIYLQIKI